MHTEYCEIDENTASRLNEYKRQGKRIIAVGTTSVRTLESMSDENGLITS
jgi:S-adenosylmethionine:tRNA ribosyltransferase-isomerase